MSEFDILASASAGMDAQRAALDLAARNVAAAQATPGGAAFERLVPRYALAPATGTDATPERFEPPEEPDDAGDTSDGGDGRQAIRYLGSRAERGSDVDTVTEMVAVLDAQRAYEADASVFDLGKRLAERTIDLGRVQ